MGVSAEVTALFVYPLKSCKPIALQQAELTPQGFKLDRQWMVVSESGRALTQREIPLMSQIHTALKDDVLVLSRAGYGSAELPLKLDASSMNQQEPRTIRLWKDQCATVPASAEASRWLTQALESTMPLQIVRMAPGFIRPQSSPEKLGEDTHIQFADTAPFLIIDEASLERLNEALSDKNETAVPMNRFRPNIVTRGLQPFGEHLLSVLGNNRYQFKFRIPCERCVIPTIDQETAAKHPGKEPFAILRDLNPLDPKRRQPLFGQYATLGEGAGSLISVGDVLQGCGSDYS